MPSPSWWSRRKSVGLAALAVTAILTVMVIVSVGCGSSTTTTTASTTGSATSETATSDTTSASPSTTGSATGETIKIGVVAPLSGIEAVIGVPEVAAIKLWAKEVNANGGILGKQVELLIEDNATDPKTTAEKTKLVLSQGAVVLTGPVLGSEWGAMIPIAQESKTIMMQPIYGMGGRAGKEWVDPLMFTIGSVPEQSVEPFDPWLREQYGTTWYYVGSDYIWSHTINTVSKGLLTQAGGKAVGDEYVAFGTTDFSAMLVRIAKAKPDLVYGTIVGADAIAFMKQFYDAGLSTTIQLTEPIDDSVIPAVGAAQSEGVPACQGYFASIDTPTNKAFVEAYKEFYPDTPPTDITASAYIALQAWQKAVELAGSTDTAAVTAKLEGLSLEDTPAGTITIRASDHYSSRTMYIAMAKSGAMAIQKDLGLIEPGPDQRTLVPK